MVSYPLGDFLIRIKNAAMARNKAVSFNASRSVLAVAQSLKKLGIIDGVKKEGKRISVTLAFKDKKPKLMSLKLISKPGLRIYMRVGEIEAKKGPSTLIISTPKGILSSREAIKKRVGGEAIAELV